MIHRSRWRRARVLLLGGIVCLAIRAEFPPSVWDGIYTEAQAQRGEAAYRQYCASCHGPKLQGTGQAPPLTGSDFTADWDLTALGDIADEIQIAMPANRPGQLPEETNAAILAYILKANHFPSGAKDLPPGADPLRGVVFVSREFGRLEPQTSVAALRHSLRAAQP
ncbi:MAG TPA: cytochrome c [Bryobacteraceae bacterium]|jgi:quinoprotein glucose dehydrogenase